MSVFHSRNLEVYLSNKCSLSALLPLNIVNLIMRTDEDNFSGPLPAELENLENLDILILSEF